jgi:AcrR family transcriptional regulator
MERLHPTKRILLETVIKLLETKKPEEILSDEVLQISGISKGSMYYHYKDWYEIIEDAICERFGRYVDRSVEMCEVAMNKSKTREDLVNFLKQVTRETQKPEQLEIRYARVQAIAMASQSNRMKLKLGSVQERLTEALEDLFREARERGWTAEDMNPRSVAVLVQSYTLGHVVDDFTPEHMDIQAWYRLIDHVVEDVFFPPK